MKKLMLATVATLALTASGMTAEKPGASAGTDAKGSAAGQSQTTGSGAQMNSGARAGAEAKDNGAKSGADVKGNAGAKRETTGSGASAEGKSDPKGSAAGQRQTSGSDSKSGAGGKAGAQTRSGADAKAGADAKSGAAARGQSETTGAAPANGSVNLTAEQKTKVRTTVLTRAPKVERSEINFSINVGTVVPRSVKLVAVPPTLVQIRPAWRGYLYFVVADEIIVVEPRTHKIVAVLAV